MTAEVLYLADRPRKAASGPGDGIVDPLAEWRSWYRAKRYTQVPDDALRRAAMAAAA